MKASFCLSVVLFLGVLNSAHAQVPQIINYQGRISVGGTNFTGTGQFKFALVNAAGTTTYWSNGVNTVSLTVTKGLYAVLLGDTTIANIAASIPATVFTNSDVRLRVWFNSGSGLQQLSPDQRIAAVGYALMASTVDPASDVTGLRLKIGTNHTLTGPWATIAGGNANLATTNFATVGGGVTNAAIGEMSVVGGGGRNVADGAHSTVSGGYSNLTFDANSTIGGGRFNTVDGWSSTVGGGNGNTASASLATVSGGGSNIAGGLRSYVGAGLQNTAATNGAAVVGGYNNMASNEFAFVGGGTNNLAGGRASVVGGGGANIASGSYATVPGGQENIASGISAFAAGTFAWATNHYSFVWADGSGATFCSSASDQFSVRAAGGVRFYSDSAESLGAQLLPNATAWSALSDRAAKANIEPINVRAILDQLMAMPVTRWSYMADPTQRRYIGPMAQDFHAAFGLGDDDKRINTLDADGVALAAIKGLYEELKEYKSLSTQVLEEKDGEIAELRARLLELERKLAEGGK